VEIFALIGGSGTGKSHKALLIAHKYNINYVIDDGLLIRKYKILAGHSAKKDKNRIQAIRTAIFEDSFLLYQTSYTSLLSYCVSRIEYCV